MLIECSSIRHADWSNTLSFTFSTLLARCTSPERCVRLLDALIPTCNEAAIGLALVVAECSEILLGHGIRLSAASEVQFVAFCLQAIDLDVPARERRALGMILGRLGDPRILVDMKSANAWVSIPPGDYRIGDARRAFILHKTVWMTRYPVTNAQYGRFIEQGGYAPDRPWWSDEGREWLVGERVREPRFWRSARWNAPNQPVVGVSFWEAEAFANWAGGRLPRESEWEAAACGEQGLAYPWGDQWEPMICNVREAGLNTTSPVGLFPRSRSKPLGLEDMAGNVWEWCQDIVGYDEGAREPARVAGMLLAR